MNRRRSCEQKHPVPVGFYRSWQFISFAFAKDDTGQRRKVKRFDHTTESLRKDKKSHQQEMAGRLSSPDIAAYCTDCQTNHQKQVHPEGAYIVGKYPGLGKYKG
jgi:hypothetical protein